jgi:hypothetical protein
LFMYTRAQAELLTFYALTTDVKPGKFTLLTCRELRPFVVRQPAESLESERREERAPG